MKDGNVKGAGMWSEHEQKKSYISAERDSDDDSTFNVLCDQQESIVTREHLASFIQALSHDLHAHPSSWQNTNLESYLGALAAVTESLAQRFQNLGETLPEQPTWKIAGDLLLTARIYE